MRLLPLKTGLVTLAIGWIAGALTGCYQGTDRTLECRAGDAQVAVQWNLVEGIDRYRVSRGTETTAPTVLGEVVGTTFVDHEAENGTRYYYYVSAATTDGSEATPLAGCASMALAGSDGLGPDAPKDLVCRAKNGRVDLTWGSVPDATSYRILREGNGQPQGEIADVVETTYADFGLVNGTPYAYSVVAIDVQGNASNASEPLSCTPIARGEGTPPPVVAAPRCRAKRDKIDVTWQPVTGAAYYQITRTRSGGTPTVIASVTGNVHTDFGLPRGVGQQYAVIAVSPTGAAAAPSNICSVRTKERGDGNKPPVFVSEPLTSAIEGYNWYIDLVATDPENDAITFSIVTGPTGMRLETPTLLTWVPSAAQIGPQTVELRATDARGAFTSQAFVVDVSDYDAPPQITSLPVRVVEAGTPYAYDVEAFDPEGAALRYSLAGSSPDGMAIDPASGVVSWAPVAADAGRRTIVVRAADPAGGFGEQRYELDVYSGTLEILEPVGEFRIGVGESLDLALRASQPAAALSAEPLPTGAEVSGGHLRFTPTADQKGRYAIAIQASLGTLRALEQIDVVVTGENRAPSLGDPGPQQVFEGDELVVSLVASDPDGDVVSLVPLSTLPENALLDSVGSRLVFRPGYEQAGSLPVEIGANDGQTTTSVAFTIEVQDRLPSAGPPELVIDRVPTPTLQTRTTISGNVVGAAGVALDPEPFVAISGLSPSTGRQGRKLDVTLTGLNTAFVQDQTAADFGPGIVVESLTVSSPTSAVARIAIDPGAALGTRVVSLSGAGPAASSIVAFVVEPGALVFTGRLVDSFSGQPLTGARVSVDGTLLEGETDADGRFSIEGVPPGAQKIVVLRNDYDVERLDLVFEAGKDVALEQDVPLDALARPFQAGGSLPRAATLASVIDRGVGAVEPDLTQEQAEALIEDTLLVVGDRFVGVFDAAGRQMNPKIAGSGMMSYTRAGLAAQAKALLEGQRYSVRDIADILTEAFPWGTVKPDAILLTDALQRFATEAWANPRDPLNAMAFILLNEGTTLATTAPIVTPETSFNRFQASLLTLSLLIPIIHELDEIADRRLIEIGIDPETVAAVSANGAAAAVASAPPAPALGERAFAMLVGVADWLVPAATAQSSGSGDVILGPNTSLEVNPFSGNTMTRVWKHMKRAFLTDVLAGNLINSLVQTSIKAGVALAIGSTGGLTGTTLAMGYIASLADGFVMSVLEKLALGYVIAVSTGSMEPSAPLPLQSFVDEDTDSLVIEFARSATDLANTNEVRQYSYEIFEFASPLQSNPSEGDVVESASLTEAPNSDRLRFSIPLGQVVPGVHYYRLATVQYASAVALPLAERRRQWAYQNQLGVDAPPLMKSLRSAGSDYTNYAKAQYRFGEIREEVIRQQVTTEMKDRLGGLTNRFSDQVAAFDVEISDLNTKKIELDGALQQLETGFEAQVGREISKLDALVGHARDQVRSGTSPSAFLDANSGASFGTKQILGFARPGDTLRPEVVEKVHGLALGEERVADGLRRRTVLSDGLTTLEDAKARLANGTLTGPERTQFQLLSTTPEGRLQYRQIDLPENPVAARTVLNLAIATETGKLTVANQLVEAGEADIVRITDELFDQEVPDHVPHEEAVSQKITERSQVERRRGEAIEARRTAKQKAYDFDIEANGIQRRNRAAVYRNARPDVKAALDGLSALGTIAQAVSETQMAFEAVRLIFSELSPPFRYVRVARNVPAYSIETDSNTLIPDGIIASRKGERFQSGSQIIDQTKTGWLLTNFLDTGGLPDRIEAGFPPEFLATDSAGRVYAHNGNSSARFGGRIFRYDPANGLAREFVGSVNYYSVLTQYGHPANPIAMNVGRIRYDGREVESLFVADVEVVGTAGVALEEPRPVIKQLPLTLLEPGEAYANPGSRNHFVGQRFVEDPRFEFTGPTDMVSFTHAGITRLYVSDQQSIYVVVHDLATGANVVREILFVPGRQWSGLALDDLSLPNFYFADATTGFVYYVKFDTLLAAESNPDAIEDNAIPLVPFVRDGSPLNIYDIEIAQNGKRIVAASARGLAATFMPAVERFEPVDPILFLKRLGRETRGLLVRALNGDLFRVLALTEEDHEAARVRIVARPPAGTTQSIQELDLPMAPVGPTRVGAQ